MNIKQLFFPSNNSLVDALEQQLVQTVQKQTPSGSTYSLTTDLANPTNMNPQILSNIWRITQAAQDPEMFWLDSDAVFNGIPDMPLTGKPYFVQTNLKKVGCYAFYVNGCTSFFESILAEVQASKRAWTITDILNNHKNEVYLFPSTNIIHYGLSIANNSNISFQFSGHGVRKLNGVLTLF